MGPAALYLERVTRQPKGSQDPTHDTPSSDSAASPSHQPPGGEAAGSSKPLPKRWSAARKAEIAIRLLKGESLDALSRETKQPASRISEWRDLFLSGGEAAMKQRADDAAEEGFDDERRRLQAKIGSQAMEIELLHDRARKLEAGLPPAQRRPRR